MTTGLRLEGEALTTKLELGTAALTVGPELEGAGIAEEVTLRETAGTEVGGAALAIDLLEFKDAEFPFATLLCLL